MCERRCGTHGHHRVAADKPRETTAAAVIGNIEEIAGRPAKPIKFGAPPAKEISISAQADVALTPDEAGFEKDILPYYGPALLARQAWICGLISETEYDVMMTDQGYRRILLLRKWGLPGVGNPDIELYEENLVRKVEREYPCRELEKLMSQP